MRVQYIVQNTTDILQTQLGPSGMFIPNENDHVNIEGKRWCVQSREVMDLNKGEIIVWLYDDTRRW